MIISLIRYKKGTDELKVASLSLVSYMAII